MTAVQVHPARGLATLRVAVCGLVGHCLVSIGTASVMLVRVVTEVRGIGRGLVSAVRRSDRPAELERQHDEHEDGEKSAHERESSGCGANLGVESLSVHSCRRLQRFRTVHAGARELCGAMRSFGPAVAAEFTLRTGASARRGKEPSRRGLNAGSPSCIQWTPRKACGPTLQVPSG